MDPRIRSRRIALERAFVVIIDSLKPAFAATIRDVDLRRRLSDAEIAEIRAAIDYYAVVVIRNQNLSNDEQLAFCERFGTPETNTETSRTRLSDKRIYDVSNINASEQTFSRDDELFLFSLANQLWHTDNSFRPVPARYSMLSCREKPPSSGGETEFADLRDAYDHLPQEMQTQLDGLVAEHAFVHSRRMLGFDRPLPRIDGLPPAHHPIVHVHAGSGRKSLYLASHASHVMGWAVPEGRMLLLDLIEHATQRQFIYQHVWNEFDLVIWDNRCTMHRGRRYPADERRDLRQTRTRDDDSSLTVDESRYAVTVSR
jgi:alpha-ketoglutarate-dependent 2,4-dichlorophenoxyacetate dioxygenase